MLSKRHLEQRPNEIFPCHALQPIFKRDRLDGLTLFSKAPPSEANVQGIG